MLRGLLAVIVAISLLTGASPSLADGPLSPGPRAGEEVTIAFTGDTLIHMPLSARAKTSDGYDFRPMFTKVAPILRGADLAICHLEVPLSPTNSDLSGYPTFSAPSQIAQALAWAGYDGCSTASNHAFDRGTGGVSDTIRIMEGAGLKQAGLSTTADSGWGAAGYELGDLRLSHVAATYWLNGYQMPAGEPWFVQLLDPDEILAIAAREKRTGSDLVIVSVHCCVEYQHEPTSAQRLLSEELIASPDVDMVVSHHSHVVGPIETIDGEYIIHGLGNFLSVQRQTPAVADGLIAMVNAKKSDEGWAIASIEIAATWVEPGTYRILPAITHRPDSYQRTMEMVALYEDVVTHLVWPGHPGYRLPKS